MYRLVYLLLVILFFVMFSCDWSFFSCCCVARILFHGFQSCVHFVRDFTLKGCLDFLLKNMLKSLLLHIHSSFGRYDSITCNWITNGVSQVSAVIPLNEWIERSVLSNLLSRDIIPTPETVMRSGHEIPDHCFYPSVCLFSIPLRYDMIRLPIFSPLQDYKRALCCLIPVILTPVVSQ